MGRAKNTINATVTAGFDSVFGSRRGIALNKGLFADTDSSEATTALQHLKELWDEGHRARVYKALEKSPAGAENNPHVQELVHYISEEMVVRINDEDERLSEFMDASSLMPAFSTEIIEQCKTHKMHLLAPESQGVQDQKAQLRMRCSLTLIASQTLPAEHGQWNKKKMNRCAVCEEIANEFANDGNTIESTVKDKYTHFQDAQAQAQYIDRQIQGMEQAHLAAIAEGSVFSQRHINDAFINNQWKALEETIASQIKTDGKDVFMRILGDDFTRLETVAKKTSSVSSKQDSLYNSLLTLKEVSDITEAWREDGQYNHDIVTRQVVSALKNKLRNLSPS